MCWNVCVCVCVEERMCVSEIECVSCVCVLTSWIAAVEQNALQLGARLVQVHGNLNALGKEDLQFVSVSARSMTCKRAHG